MPPLCLGGNVYGWTLSEADSFANSTQHSKLVSILSIPPMFTRAGHRVIRGGESETIIGKWLATGNKRSNVIIATKVGMDLGNGKTGLKPEYIAQAVEDSLRRLQTDYIDLYQAHRDDEETPLEETLAAFDKLVRAGKVRHIGASNYSATPSQTSPARQQIQWPGLLRLSAAPVQPGSA